MPSYHDLHITTRLTQRTSIFSLPYGWDVRCCRTSGWQLWDVSAFRSQTGELIASEYSSDPANGMILDVAGHVIVDSLTEKGGTSFPYLTVAREHRVPYGDVVRFAEDLEICPSISVDEGLSLWQQATVTAWAAERRRRAVLVNAS